MTTIQELRLRELQCELAELKAHYEESSLEASNHYWEAVTLKEQAIELYLKYIQEQEGAEPEPEPEPEPDPLLEVLIKMMATSMEVRAETARRRGDVEVARLSQEAAQFGQAFLASEKANPSQCNCQGGCCSEKPSR